LPLTDEIGLGMGAAILAWHLVRHRGRRRAEAAHSTGR
jgi:hypothetical protein